MEPTTIVEPATILYRPHDHRMLLTVGVWARGVSASFAFSSMESSPLPPPTPPPPPPLLRHGAGPLVPGVRGVIVESDGTGEGVSEWLSEGPSEGLIEGLKACGASDLP